MLLLNLIQVTESISGSVVPLAMFNKRNNQVAINRDNRKSLENAIDMQLQLLQVVERTLNIESRCKFQQLRQSSVRMFEASTWKKWPSSNHSGGAGQAELAGGAWAKLSHGHHGRPPRHTGTLTQQYISKTSFNCTFQPRGTCVDIESEGGVGFNNCEPSDLHPNMCSYPPTSSSSSSSGAPPAAQFGPGLLLSSSQQQQSVGEPDISELYLYSNHSRRVPEVAYSCN